MAMEGMVLVSVRAWLLGRAVVNLPTHCSKCVIIIIIKENTRIIYVDFLH